MGNEGKRPSPLPSPLGRGGVSEGSTWSALSLAWELGYTIAIPIVVLALVGRWADREWGTTPWLLLAGIVVSTMISSFAVYRKVKKIL